jgi:O-antigen ligase
VYWVLFVLFTVTMFLLASKTGIAVWLLLMLYALSLYYVTTRKIKQILLLLVAGIALFVILLFTNQKLFLRFREVYHVLVLNDSGNAFSSTTARSRIWPLAVDLIKKQPLGYGTGAEKATLKQAYLKNGMTDAYEKELNAHNQFLQTALAVGLPGLLLLMALLVRFLAVGYIYNEWLLFGFGFITMVNFITESMLETQAGVVFFAFFYTLLDAYFRRDYAYLRKKNTIFTPVKYN